MNQNTKKNEEDFKRHIGLLLDFREIDFSVIKGKYKGLAEELNVAIKELQVSYTRPIDESVLSKIKKNQTQDLIDEHLKKLEDDAKQVSMSVAIIVRGNLEAQAYDLQRKFAKLRSIYAKYPECQKTLPLVDGFPAVTEEFTETLRTEFEYRIRTESEAKFYDKFLKAKELVSELIAMGGVPGFHIDLHRDGLYLGPIPG